MVVAVVRAIGTFARLASPAFLTLAVAVGRLVTATVVGATHGAPFNVA